ncbi:ABC transporter ATP-binding protein [Acidiferrimicrobium sp. IK]|uniref:ABC transporter ATP-binding protein n=1 Tax=Acidiferrimicrobium sp. IK TaxID=2871700 RepID=UPI0029167B23|nr:ABC transporter ATP-binding protein [Acidiferrimicrobium sp. IK]MCU4184287.1 ABC transporter ATP-binding protein [Acidiferrimicrobium sp. IK]
MALLDIDHLRVSFRTEGGTVQAVDDVSFSLEPGEILGIVGESGSGKSVTAMTIMGLTRSPNASFAGRITLTGPDGATTDLLAASNHQLESIRGARVAMIFQDPMTALNPVHRVGDQIAEQIRAHEPVGKRAATARAVDLLRRVGIPRPDERARSFPHEFSGGMRQRVMIAMTLSCSPQVLIADEPTTALDVTIQAQILAEIEDLRAETGVGVLLITHDLGVIAEVADRVAVMYAGRVVEQGDLRTMFTDPLHPYTWGLLGSVPRIDKDRPGRLPTIPGAPPSLQNTPKGCHFAPRCPHRFERCGEVPPLEAADATAPGHLDRCWLALDTKRKVRIVNGTIGLPAASPAGADTAGVR